VQPQPAPEPIFSDVPGGQVRSAGTEEAARIRVTPGHLGWADVIVVMEKRHQERLHQKHPEAMAGRPCLCLFIEDDYEFMDPDLVQALRQRLREHFPETLPA
jgi:predicted protein tyrosine phosphatase